MAASKYERKVFKDVIKQTIYDAIVKGELKQGDRIIETEWTERFGSSQTPVREAIRDLEARGVLETVPFKGAVVRTIDKDKLKEIHAIRAGLETVALKVIIGKISEKDIRKLKRILDDMMKYAEECNYEKFIDKDIEFHESIVDHTNMSDLKRMWNMCNIRLWTSYSTKSSREEMIELAKNHEAIYKKIEDRDATGLFETIYAHFSVVTDAID